MSEPHAITEQEPVPVHAPADQWVCLKCGASNSPVVVEEGDQQILKPSTSCWECEEPRHEKLEELGATRKTIEALAGAVAAHAQNAADAESVERPAGETSIPVAQPGLTFPTAAFDPSTAFDAIAKQNRIVRAARAEYEDLKGQASESKKTLESEEKTLSNLINREYEKKCGGSQQPYLREVDHEAASCSVSSAMGAPCPACASQRAKGVPADVNDPLHQAHAQHEAIAKSLLVRDAQDLSTRLTSKHFYMDAAAIMLLPIDELLILQRYSVQNGVVPPELLVSAHVAAAAGTDRQECKVCGLVLVNQQDANRSFYPEHAAVGLDCEGRPYGEIIATQAARVPQSHAKRDKRKKSDPEAERREQKSEGRKKATEKAKKR